MVWGHVSSPDLERWTAHPIAIEPSLPCDALGVWTGCVVEHQGRYLAFYTGISSWDGLVQHQCLATSTDLMTWEKHGVVIESKPDGTGPCFRDPQLFRWNDEWRMVVGSQTPKGGAVQLYAPLSASLDKWEHVGPLWEADDCSLGYDCECPDFFQMGGSETDNWVLITSRGSVHWQAGSFDGERFRSSRQGVCDGPKIAPTSPEDSPFAAFYAAKSAADDRGRRLLFGWATKAGGDGWKGAIATPRELFLDPDDGLALRVPLEAQHRFHSLPSGAQRSQDGALLEVISPSGEWRTSPDDEQWWMNS